MKDKEFRESEADPTWAEPIERARLRLDASIAAALGYLVEIQDGLIKCWEKGAIPDETNWVTAPRFSERETLTEEALLKREIPHSVLPEPGGGWVCRFEQNGSPRETPAQFDEATALATALFLVLMRDSQN
ncbi:hypothetical protein [Paraburkholderia sp.]|uniref:hypothetical protein n=1 Tax=Paraburkholderia sp. TaxID=1926495 RepID=UPI0039E36001